MGIGGSHRSDPEQQGDVSLRALGRLLAGIPPDPGLDWGKALDLARRHGVSPFLFWQLEKEPREGMVSSRKDVPEWVREALQVDFYGAAARGLRAERQLARVLGALIEGGVSALVVKGAAIGAFYPDPALRAYGDLDLLVSPGQVQLAQEILNGLGYRSFKSSTWALEHEHQLPPMVSDAGQLAVEIHWRLDHPERVGQIPAEDLWRRAEPWHIDDQAAQRLEVVDAVLHLCWHAVVQHRLRLGIRPICDLAQVTNHWGLDEWDALVERATEYGLERIVHLMLVLGRQVMGLDAPGKGSLLLSTDSVRLPNDLAERLLALEPSKMILAPVALIQVAEKSNNSLRLQHLFWRLFRNRDFMATKYNVPANSPRIWLTYLWRPIDLLRRYGKGTWGALRGDPASREAWAREAWLERWLRRERMKR